MYNLTYYEYAIDQNHACAVSSRLHFAYCYIEKKVTRIELSKAAQKVPVKLYIVLIYIDFQILRGLDSVFDSSKHSISYIVVCQVFSEVVMALKYQSHSLLSKEVDKGIAFLKGHVTGTALGGVCVEEVCVGKDNTVAIILTVLVEK